MKTTFEDFEKTLLHANLVATYKSGIEIQTTAEGRALNEEQFLTAIKTAFLVGHQLGLDEARAILVGEKEMKE